MNDAVHANAQVDITFMRNPQNPVVDIVAVSISDTAADIPNAAAGPYMNPPIVIMTSFGSYLRKSSGAIGMRNSSTAT